MQFSQFNLLYKKDSYGGSRIIPSFFGFENFGPVIFLGRLKIGPNDHLFLKFYRVPPLGFRVIADDTILFAEKSRSYVRFTLFPMGNLIKIFIPITMLSKLSIDYA